MGRKAKGRRDLFNIHEFVVFHNLTIEKSFSFSLADMLIKTSDCEKANLRILGNAFLHVRLSLEKQYLRIILHSFLNADLA